MTTHAKVDVPRQKAEKSHKLRAQICIKYSRFITCQSNTSKGRGPDRLPNWNPKNGGMLISQPISRCLTNHSELCMSRLLNNQRRISIYRLQRRPSFGFESSASSTPMTSGETLWVTRCDPIRHVSSSSGLATAVSELLYQCYFTLLLL